MRMVPPPHTDWQWYTREEFIEHYGSEPAGVVKWGAAIEPAKRKHLHWHPSAERRVVATVNSDGIAYTYHEFMEFFSSLASFYWDLAVPLIMPNTGVLVHHMNHARFDRVMKIDMAEEESLETEGHSPRGHLQSVREWQCRCWRAGPIMNHVGFDRVTKTDIAEEESSETEGHSPRRHLQSVREWQCRCWRVGMISLLILFVGLGAKRHQKHGLFNATGF